MRTLLPSAVLALLLVLVPAPSRAELPRTVAETSDYKATSRHADVVAFCERLAKEAPLVRLGELGTSQEGRKLPLVIVADPPVAGAAEAAKTGKVVVFALGNIHAGEVDGKEALLMLARDLATTKGHPLLKDLVFVFAPIFNADGNEKIGKGNRPGQNGPEEGSGVRANAQGLDLNRDFVKLDSPEVRTLVRFLNEWDPAVVVDCHTTNGSYHRYTLTYEGGGCPAGDPKVVDYVRDVLLPDAGKRLEKATGFKSFFYGNFSRDRSLWETVPPQPRYGTHYVSLRHRIAVLSESYTYASFKDRVLATHAFVRSIAEHVAENKDAVRKLLSSARSPAGDAVALRFKAAPHGRPQTLLGYEEEVKDGRRVRTDRPKNYEVQYTGGAEVTLAVKRPWAYLVPAALAKATETLQRHGVVVDELREDLDLDVEAYRVDKVARAGLYQKHQPVALEATPRKESRRVEAGTFVVKTAQPLGNLAAFFLEPQSSDGLATWNFFDAALQEGKDFPVLRLPAAPAPLTTSRARPLPEDRKTGKRITYEAFTRRALPDFNGAPAQAQRWLDDDHFVQVKDGRPWKVDAATGRCEPLPDERDKMAKGLAALPTVGRAAEGLTRPPLARYSPQRGAIVAQHGGDLYHVTAEGKAVRLTKSPGPKELITFSPDGQFVAFVRGNNLYVVDVKTQTEKALTEDGSDLVFNGKGDWVYTEEVFDRREGAYWWSPDSTHLVFLRIDDTPVRKFTVLDQLPVRGRAETTPYPKTGDPNPTVKVGVAAVAGGGVRWADLGRYSENASLVARAGWTPDSQRAYFYVQDRAQTWLDVCTIPRDGEEVACLFRETTKAWVDEPGVPTFLKDGSFLLPSARTGYKHLYHFAKDGKVLNALTSGPWEVTGGLFAADPVERVDEEAGWVYFTGKRDNPVGTNLYRVRLDGSSLERLTSEPGDHRVSLSPKAKYFVDTNSGYSSPTQVRVVRNDGTLVRRLDTNPVYVLDEYQFGKSELVKVPTPDGFVLEGSVTRPPDFDPAKKYPVWFMTYGGPAAPTIRDTWGGGHTRDQMLASLGFVVFHCDPRSASGKGAAATWTAYRQLGVQELKDVETAVTWLCKQPGIDAARVGMSGSSYGGFMTAFALTHSKLFAAGVSSAPVTDWHNYDSVYTERYMNTPQENPDGYKKTSVVRAAANLHGRLLLVHGLMDDNVHVQNALQFVDALQRANKDFEVMFYPRSRHGGFGPHYARLEIDFMKRVLKPEAH